MIVDLSTEWLQDLKPKAQSIQELTRHKYGAKRHKVDLRMFTGDELAKLEEMTKTRKGGGWRVMLQSIETFKLMMADPGGHPISKINELVAPMVKHFEAKAPKKWVFAVVGNKRLPYFVHEIEYTPPKRRDNWTSPAHVTMTLKAAHGEEAKIVWYQRDLEGKPTVGKLLWRKGVQTENDALMAAYTAEMETWNRVTNELGAQYTAGGVAVGASTSWWSTAEIQMEREGKRARVVIDNGAEASSKDEETRYTRRKNSSKGSTGNRGFWNKQAGISKPPRRDEDEDEDVWDEHGHAKVAAVTEVDSDIVVLPVHPWVDIFDLELHQFAQIHVADLEPYEWDDALIDKLVLPDETAELIDALVVNADEVMEDIIKGKTGGTIVISTGPPGTGKTLTAEVMSEVARRALYRVDCSQLGTDVETIEKRLAVILARATRWGAVLLIDEADVYIRARGNEIAQNAIVGVFLRLLEYYHGILFLTSNRALIIDDAILQRATAWVRYDIPTETEKVRIWEILAAQYQVSLDEELVLKLAQRWPKSSGRNIKMMLKLSRVLAKSEKRTGMALFEMAAKFLDVPDETNNKRRARADNDIDGRAP